MTPEPLTPDELDAIAARAEEWLAAPIVGHGLYARYLDARELVPALVEEVRRQAARIEVLEGALREIEPIVRTARGSQYPYSCERAWDICRSVLGEEHTPT